MQGHQARSDRSLSWHRYLTFDKFGKRFRQFSYLVANIPHHVRLAGALGTTPGGSAVRWKYLGDYLSLDLDNAQRRAVLEAHYRTVSRIARGAPVFSRGLEVWRNEVVEGRPPLAITIEPAKLAPMEGELQLTFSFHTDIFALTFAFCPGPLFGVVDECAILVGGVQGAFGSFDEIREATKLNADISPPNMLMLALRALAKVAGASVILCVGEENQVSVGYARDRIKLDYPRLWLEQGGEPFGRYYCIPLDQPQKPLSEVPRTHRSRARRRRERRMALMAGMEARIAAGLAAQA